MRYHFKVTKEKQGYSAVCVELPGCVTQGESKDELQKNMSEALHLFLEEPYDSKLVFAMPKKRVSGNGIAEIQVRPRVAFAFALRMSRLRKKLTQREAKDLIGITGSLNNYQRLEKAETANPVLETLVLIKRAFPDFPIEQVAT